MNLTDFLFNEPALNQDEENLLRQVFSNPVVRKYLRVLAQNEVSDFISANMLEDPEILYARKLMDLQGKLSILSTLISISEK